MCLFWSKKSRPGGHESKANQKQKQELGDVCKQQQVSTKNEKNEELGESGSGRSEVEAAMLLVSKAKTKHVSQLHHETTLVSSHWLTWNTNHSTTFFVFGEDLNVTALSASCYIITILLAHHNQCFSLSLFVCNLQPKENYSLLSSNGC